MATYTITTHRARAGRIDSGGATATIALDDGTTKTSPRHADADAATTWAERYIAALEAGTIQHARPAAPAIETQARPDTRRDRQADRVAAIAGLPATRPTGRCHYCGQPLTGGRCDECI